MPLPERLRLLEPGGPVAFTLVAGGDVGLVGTGRARARREGYAAAFAPLAPHLQAGDLAFLNFEMAVGRREWVRPGRTEDFWHDPEVAEAIAAAGVDVVSVANNHIMDCGPQGLEATLEACAAAGLTTVGAGADLAAARQPARFEVRGQRVVLLAYSASFGDAAGEGRPGVAPLSAELIEEDLRKWRPQADLLIVSAHWGSMYVDYPAPRVLDLARRLAESKADLILGHHPHVTQGFRRDGRHLTLFSLGEAVFNSHAGDFHASVGSDQRREAALFTVEIATQPGLTMQAFRLDDDGFPVPATAERAVAHHERLLRISQDLDEAARRFHAESAPQLLRYELEAVGHYLRQGRWGRIVKLMSTLKWRHVPLLWHAMLRYGGDRSRRERFHEPR